VGGREGTETSVTPRQGRRKVPAVCAYTNSSASRLFLEQSFTYRFLSSQNFRVGEKQNHLAQVHDFPTKKSRLRGGVDLHSMTQEVNTERRHLKLQPAVALVRFLELSTAHGCHPERRILFHSLIRIWEGQIGQRNGDVKVGS
jgi:hypothetical protein